MMGKNLANALWREKMILTRHVGVGIMNTLVGFLVIFSAMGLGLSPLLANVAGYAVGFILGFFISKKFVFRSDGYLATEGILYLIAFVISFGFNLLVLHASLTYLSLHVIASQILAGIAFTMLMYILSRVFVYKTVIITN